MLWGLVLSLGVASCRGGGVIRPAGLTRLRGGDGPDMDLVVNASNINSMQSKAVVEHLVDSEFVKLLGPSESASACASLCRAYVGGNGSECRSFSRFSSEHENATLAGLCFGHTDRVWLPLRVAKVDAGLLTRACRTDLDCSLNGICSGAPDDLDVDAEAACACDPGWTGERCESLDLLPVDADVLGFDPRSEDGRNMSSWGGGILQLGDAFHLWASELANHCGISSYILNSGVVHATASDVAGPFVKRGDFVIPPFAHEPVVVRAPTGEVALGATQGCLAVPSQLLSRLSDHTRVVTHSRHPTRPSKRDERVPRRVVGTPPRERLEIHFRSSQMNTLERVEGSLSLGDSEERSREPSKVTRSARLVLPRSCSSPSPAL